MSSKGNCKETVLKYLVNQNRPYSANDIVQNLHNEFSRGALQKALDELSQENKIREKVYGKQKVYSCIQRDDSESSDTALKLGELDAEIEKAVGRLRELEKSFKVTDDELKNLECQPTTEVAQQQIEELEKTIENLQNEVTNSSHAETEVCEEEKNELNNRYAKLSKEHRKRKRMCMDIVHSILENYPKKMSILLDEIGIEIDTDGVASN